MSLEIVTDPVEAVARQMAIDVDLDWVLIKEGWREEYRRRAHSALEAERSAQAGFYTFEWPESLLP